MIVHIVDAWHLRLFLLAATAEHGHHAAILGVLQRTIYRHPVANAERVLLNMGHHILQQQSIAVVDSQRVFVDACVGNGVSYGARHLFAHEHAHHGTHVEAFHFAHHARHHIHHVFHAFHASHCSADARHDAADEVADAVGSFGFMTFFLGVGNGLGYGEGIGATTSHVF